MSYALFETNTSIDGTDVAVTVDSWIPREQIEEAVGTLELDRIARDAIADALHRWTDATSLRGTPLRCEVTVYLTSAEDGGDLRTIPTLVVDAGRDGLDLIGVQEAARIAGISHDGIHQARRRGTMPEPIPVAGTDVTVWRRADVERWAATRRGRGRPRSA